MPTLLAPISRAATPARLLASLLAGLLIISAGCNGKTAPTPPQPKVAPKPAATDAALTIDGVSITHGEIDALVKFFQEIDPRMGRSKCIRAILDQHLIPLAFVQQQLGEQLREQRIRADALVKTLGQAGYDELVEKAARIPGFEIVKDIVRQHVTIPQQQWLFDDTKIGRMSPVLASPRGYSVVAAKDKRAGPTTAYDHADVVVVRFEVLSVKEFDKWYADLKDRLKQLPASAIDYHQDLKDALPPWLPTS